MKYTIHKGWLTALILGFFVVVNAGAHRGGFSEDLASSYLACKLILSGQSEHIYDYHPAYYSRVGSKVWAEEARSLSTPVRLHPYVQLPLWAFILTPLCSTLGLDVFSTLFLVLEFSALAGIVVLVARMWAPQFHERPWQLLALLSVLSVSMPVIYMGYLAQTHPLFMFALLLAVYFADRDKPVRAGLALAIAACVKITPALFALYWLVTRQWKAAGFFLLWMVALAVASILAMGMEINLLFVDNLTRISDILLLSRNNQSFAAWYFDGMAPVASLKIRDLPTSGTLMQYGFIAIALVFIERLYAAEPEKRKVYHPFCVSLFLLVSLMFANIAWNHYYFVLVVPLMVMIANTMENKKYTLWLRGGIGVAVALNLWPFSIDTVTSRITMFSVMHSQFYSGVLCIGMLVVCLALLSRSPIKGAVDE